MGYDHLLLEVRFCPALDDPIISLKKDFPHMTFEQLNALLSLLFTWNWSSDYFLDTALSKNWNIGSDVDTWSMVTLESRSAGLWSYPQDHSDKHSIWNKSITFPNKHRFLSNHYIFINIQLDYFTPCNFIWMIPTDVGHHSTAHSSSFCPYHLYKMSCTINISENLNSIHLHMDTLSYTYL